MHKQRIETVRHLLKEMGLTQMIVSDPRSIQYLTGAYVEPGERFLALAITEGKARPFLESPVHSRKIATMRRILV